MIRPPHRRRLAPASLCALLLLFLLSPSDCVRKKKLDPSSIPRMDFHVNEALLGPAATDPQLRLTIRPPAFLIPADPSHLKQVQEQAQAQQKPDDPLAFAPVMIFGRPNSAVLCTVSRFLRPPKGGMDQDWLEMCRTRTRQMVSPAEVKDDLFRIGDAVALQFVIQTGQLEILRLICQGPGANLVRVDYVIPRAEYKITIDAVESSVGSLVLY